MSKAPDIQENTHIYQRHFGPRSFKVPAVTQEAKELLQDCKQEIDRIIDYVKKRIEVNFANGCTTPLDQILQHKPGLLKDAYIKRAFSCDSKAYDDDITLFAISTFVRDKFPSSFSKFKAGWKLFKGGQFHPENYGEGTTTCLDVASLCVYLASLYSIEMDVKEIGNHYHHVAQEKNAPYRIIDIATCKDRNGFVQDPSKYKEILQLNKEEQERKAAERKDEMARRVR